MSTSATGGYLAQVQEALPGGLTVIQTIQQVIVGITGLAGNFVRPKWQVNPGKERPLPTDDWCAFGVSNSTPDANAYEEVKADGLSSKLQRYEELNILCSFYGPNNFINAGYLRDGFQIAQNRAALQAAKMGFKEVGQIINVPELHGQIWFPRCDITLTLRREINKSIEVLSVTSAEGTINGLLGDNNLVETIPWDVSQE